VEKGARGMMIRQCINIAINREATMASLSVKNPWNLTDVSKCIEIRGLHRHSREFLPLLLGASWLIKLKSTMYTVLSCVELPGLMSFLLSLPTTSSLFSPSHSQSPAPIVMALVRGSPWMQ
jgi:hypothetical protein